MSRRRWIHALRSALYVAHVVRRALRGVYRACAVQLRRDHAEEHGYRPWQIYERCYPGERATFDRLVVPDGGVASAPLQAGQDHFEIRYPELGTYKATVNWMNGNIQVGLAPGYLYAASEFGRPAPEYPTVMGGRGTAENPHWSPTTVFVINSYLESLVAHQVWHRAVDDRALSDRSKTGRPHAT
jgi:hypothetical protein